MKCFLCKKEAEQFSPKYVELVCIDCETSLTNSSESHKRFMKKYDRDHKCCPVCGSDSYSTTLVDYFFNSENPESYKDLNDCTCSVCGDTHTAHERVTKTPRYTTEVLKIHPIRVWDAFDEDLPQHFINPITNELTGEWPDGLHFMVDVFTGNIKKIFIVQAGDLVQVFDDSDTH